MNIIINSYTCMYSPAIGYRFGVLDIHNTSTQAFSRYGGHIEYIKLKHIMGFPFGKDSKFAWRNKARRLLLSSIWSLVHCFIVMAETQRVEKLRNYLSVSSSDGENGSNAHALWINKHRWLPKRSSCSISMVQ